VTIERHPSLHAYFFEEVESAIGDLGVRASRMASFYVVRLLAEHTRLRAGLGDEPLGLQLVRLQEAPAPERARGLREVGDTALVLSGFFRESLRDALVDADYYAQLGSAAYQQAGHLLRALAARRELADVLAELADNFDRFVAVLAQVGEASLSASEDTDQLVQRWIRTRSEALASRLRGRGLLLPDAAEDN
jgi:hypothetical protein